MTASIRPALAVPVVLRAEAQLPGQACCRSALRRAAAVEQRRHAEAAHGFQHDLDVAVRQGALNGEGFARSGEGFVAEHTISDRLFQALFGRLLSRRQSANRRRRGMGFRFKNPLYSLNSTVLDLCLSMYPWAAIAEYLLFSVNPGKYRVVNVLYSSGLSRL